MAHEGDAPDRPKRVEVYLTGSRSPRQTAAERHLVRTLASVLESRDDGSDPPRILNAGAGRSVSIEEQLASLGRRCVSDRIDIEECAVEHPSAGRSWICSIEEMKPVESGRYLAVFANYVLEHVAALDEASREVFRVLVPGGYFIATVPNVAAPEFTVAKHTPLWFHKLVRRHHAWETEYAYGSIPELVAVFARAGFRLEDERRWPSVHGYLCRYPVLCGLGRLYDGAISALGWRSWMGDACVVMRRPEGGASKA